MSHRLICFWPKCCVHSCGGALELPLPLCAVIGGGGWEEALDYDWELGLFCLLRRLWQGLVALEPGSPLLWAGQYW